MLTLIPSPSIVIMFKNAFLLMLALVLYSCAPKKSYNYLSSAQFSFLNTPSSNTVLIFHNGISKDTMVVGSIERGIDDAYEDKGYQFHRDHYYYGEFGQVTYTNHNAGGTYITLSAFEPNAYNFSNRASQTVKIFARSPQFIYFSLDFKSPTSSKYIGGILYDNVHISTAGPDSLFWKEDLGILGWRDSTASEAAYRIF